MAYWQFDLLVLVLPAVLLLRRAPHRRLLLGADPALVAVALLWTGPWDEHLVREGVWSSPDDRVLARLGSVPVEEYAFVALMVLLVGAWALRTGALPLAPVPPGPASARRRGAAAWAAVALLGLVLAGVGGHVTYLGLLLVWAAPPLALQRAVAGDVLRARALTRAVVGVPVALWLCVADRMALADGIWSIAPDSSTGLAVLGLPVEEGLFFCLTCLLVTDGLLLAADRDVLARALRLVRAHVPGGGRTVRT